MLLSVRTEWNSLFYTSRHQENRDRRDKSIYRIYKKYKTKGEKYNRDKRESVDIINKMIW